MMQANLSVSFSTPVKSLPLTSGKRQLVSLGPVNGLEHPWAYTLFVDVFPGDVIKGFVLSTSLLADHALMHDRLAIVVAKGKEVWEGTVRIQAISQTESAGKMGLTMAIESLSLCKPFDQVTVPRT